MSEYQAPKGTFDILPEQAKDPWQRIEYWHFCEEKIRFLADLYGYREIRTPIYESTALFDRGVGESSDIVSKEMFRFEDKAKRSLSLRPEGTSSIMRAFIEHRLSPPQKVFYIGAMFRYERPQSGRFRQHHQFGVEAIGSSAPEQDAEVIDLLLEFFRRIGLKGYSLHINSVGDNQSRTSYKAALLKFLQPHFSQLSEESKIRFEKNPLRILDSKSAQDIEILKKAPSILDFLSKEASKHFEKVCETLDTIGIPYVVNEKIVRGLDYYDKTVFEVLLNDRLAIGAGGRFDGLLSSLKGPDLPAIGFASGLERIIQALHAQNIEAKKIPSPLLYFIPLGEESLATCFTLLTKCRRADFSAEIDLSKKKASFCLQNALKKNARYAVLIGSEEIKSKSLQIKDLKSRSQEEIPWDSLIEKCRNPH